MLRAAAAAGCIVALGGCRGGDGARATGTTTTVGGTSSTVVRSAVQPPLPETVVVGEAATPSVGIYDSPGQADPPRRTVSSPLAYGGNAVFVVDQDAQPATTGWVKVGLPVRPTGSSGWVKASELRLSQHDYRIVVELGAHRLTLFKGSVAVRAVDVAVGRDTRRTPDGIYFTSELVKPKTPDSAYGAYAYGLTAWTSPADTPDNPVDGQLGLQGTNDISTLGRDTTNGSIRVSDADIRAFAETLPLGVPVIVERS